MSQKPSLVQSAQSVPGALTPDTTGATCSRFWHAVLKDILTVKMGTLAVWRSGGLNNQRFPREVPAVEIRHGIVEAEKTVEGEDRLTAGGADGEITAERGVVRIADWWHCREPI